MARYKENFCLGCQRNHNITEFYPSDNPFHANGLTPYCKEKCKEIMEYYMKDFCSVEKALYLTCAIVGVPFLTDVYERFDLFRKKETDVNQLNPFYIYYRELQKIRKDGDGLVDFSKTDLDYRDVFSGKQALEIIKADSEELRLIWGDKNLEDLQYLEYRYSIYTEDKEMTEYQSKLYRTLCLAELDEYRGNDVKGAVDRQAKIAKTLGIDQFNIDRELSMVEKMLENQIAIMENNEPAIYYKDLEKYADFMGIGNYWENHVIRPLRNLLLNSKEYNILPDNIVDNEDNG